MIFNLDPKKYIVNVKDRIGKDTNYKIYDQKTKNKLNWGDKINLDEGIDSTIKWYLRYKKKFKTKETKFKIKL